MKMKALIKKHLLEIIIIGSILLIALLALLVINLAMPKGDYVVVIYDKVEVERYPLTAEISKNLSYEDNHYNYLIIKDGKAFILQASCPDKICVKQRPISKVGQTITCLPNKLVIKIVGKTSTVDMVS